MTSNVNRSWTAQDDADNEAAIQRSYTEVDEVDDSEAEREARRVEAELDEVEWAMRLTGAWSPA